MFEDRRRWKTDDVEGNDDDGDDRGGQLLESTQSTDDGFAEDILESSDVLIKSKLLSLSLRSCRGEMFWGNACQLVEGSYVQYSF